MSKQTERIPARCTNCQAKMQVPVKYLNKKIKCPKCKNLFAVVDVAAKSTANNTPSQSEENGQHDAVASDKKPTKKRLEQAIESGDLNTVKEIIEDHPQLVNEELHEYHPALKLAVIYNQFEIVKTLVSQGAEGFWEGAMGGGNIFEWVSTDEMAELLIDLGFDIKKKHGQHVVLRAITRPQTVDILCRHGAEVNGTCNAGSLLHFAGKMRAVRCCESMLKAGANPNSRNSDGALPIDYLLQGLSQDASRYAGMTSSDGISADGLMMNMAGQALTLFAKYGSERPQSLTAQAWEEIRVSVAEPDDVVECVKCKTQITRDTADQSEGKCPKCNTSRCFIATAACGSPLAVEVQVLRDFRDQRLSKTCAGTMAIACYERLSPPVARLISRSDTARKIVRASVVRPGAWFAKKLMGERQGE